MKIFFRVDASVRMGIGHFMRCLTLADALRERGAELLFITRKHEGNLITLLKQRGIPVRVLPVPVQIAEDTENEDYENWLGVTQAEDADQTIKALNGEKPDWLVIDHYGLNVGWEKRVRQNVGKIMVIDDLANRQHDCNILLDQNYSEKDELRYKGLIPDAGKLLVGQRYALLHSAYATHLKTLQVRDGQVTRVLVFFGGSDSHNITGLVLEALSEPELSHLHVDVIIGTYNPHKQLLEDMALHRPYTTIYGLHPHLADLMARVDLAIGASGATIWERMCLGLPSIVITTAENQKPIAEALKKVNLIQYIGHYTGIDKNLLSQKIVQIINDPECLTEMSVRNQLQVDGYGVNRVTEVIYPTNAIALQMRPAISDDCILYYHWVNDPAVRESAMNSQSISWQSHSEWFSNKIQDEHTSLFVLEAAGLPIGQIRFEEIGDEAWIDYSLDSIVRGRGWGTRLVALGMDLLKSDKPVHFCAEVKPNNKVSRSIFLRLGFVEKEDRGKVFYYDNLKSSKLAERLHS